MENHLENLKDLIKIDRGINLPILGGSGKSIDDAIIIEKSEEYNCVNVEYILLDFFCEVIGNEWKLLEQHLSHHNDRRIDILKIETTQIVVEEIIIEIENYYFDVTDCF
ncbi:MAG: hypothetical protein ABI091_03030 [Ferruginibacter sp.]